jgi:hypothetical protein
LSHNSSVSFVPRLHLVSPLIWGIYIWHTLSLVICILGFRVVGLRGRRGGTGRCGNWEAEAEKSGKGGCTIFRSFSCYIPPNLSFCRRCLAFLLSMGTQLFGRHVSGGCKCRFEVLRWSSVWVGIDTPRLQMSAKRLGMVGDGRKIYGLILLAMLLASTEVGG